MNHMYCLQLHIAHLIDPAGECHDVKKTVTSTSTKPTRALASQPYVPYTRQPDLPTPETVSQSVSQGEPIAKKQVTRIFEPIWEDGICTFVLNEAARAADRRHLAEAVNTPKPDSRNPDHQSR